MDAKFIKDGIKWAKARHKDFDAQKAQVKEVAELTMSEDDIASFVMGALSGHAHTDQYSTDYKFNISDMLRKGFVGAVSATTIPMDSSDSWSYCAEYKTTISFVIHRPATDEDVFKQHYAKDYSDWLEYERLKKKFKGQ